MIPTALCTAYPDCLKGSPGRVTGAVPGDRVPDARSSPDRAGGRQGVVELNGIAPGALSNTESPGTAVILDDQSSAPIPHLWIAGESSAGQRFSGESDSSGTIELPAGSWHLETPSSQYRLRTNSVTMDTGEAGVILWATSTRCARLRVMDSLTRSPIPGASVTVNLDPFTDASSIKEFVTNADG